MPGGDIFREVVARLALVLRRGGDFCESLAFEDWLHLGHLRANGELVGREHDGSRNLLESLNRLLAGRGLT